MNRILALLVVPIIACWMVTIPVIAQTTSGSISGTVTDASRAGIPGARVTAVSTQTGAQRASVTGGDGRYQLPGLPPGIYDLRVEKEGFNTIIQQGIVLQVTQDAVLSVALRVGIMKQEFTVSAAPPLLDTTNAQVSGVVTEQTLTQLPLNGRDLSQLIQLQVGVAPVTNAGPNPFSEGNITKVAVNGTRPTMTNNTLDGGDINDPGFNIPPGGTAGIQLGVDAIEEYRVILNPYDAQYGRNGAPTYNT